MIHFVIDGLDSLSSHQQVVTWTGLLDLRIRLWRDSYPMVPVERV